MANLVIFIAANLVAFSALVSVNWPLFICPGLWNAIDLDCILCKGDHQLFTFTGKSRYLEAENLPGNKIRKNTAGHILFL